MLILHVFGVGHRVFLPRIESTVVVHCSWRVDSRIMATSLKLVVTARPLLNARVRSIWVCLSWVRVAHPIGHVGVLVAWTSAICLSVQQQPPIILHWLVLYVIEQSLPRLALA